MTTTFSWGLIQSPSDLKTVFVLGLKHGHCSLIPCVKNSKSKGSQYKHFFHLENIHKQETKTRKAPVMQCAKIVPTSESVLICFEMNLTFDT